MASPTINEGPPYAPTTWTLGGTPTVDIDIPIQTALLVLFMVGAATHMAIFRLNKRRGYKFLFNVFLFGFCMSRIITSVLRIASIKLHHNLALAIATQLFIGAGVLIIFIINLFFSLRIIRAVHPTIGWHPIVSVSFKLIYFLVFATLVMIITVTVQVYFTLDPSILSIDHAIGLHGTTLPAVISFLPIPLMLVVLAVPRSQPVDSFGTGTMGAKICTLLTAATVLGVGAWYKAGTAYLTPVAKTQPLPAYYNRTAFYVFNFIVEILVVYLYAVMRIDLRFYIPDGAKGPGSYSSKTCVGAGDGAQSNEDGGEGVVCHVTSR